MTPRWTHKLPSEYRVLQPHERVQNGDYYQIGTAYALIDDADRHRYVGPTGGMYGTFWRKQDQRPLGVTPARMGEEG